MASTRPTVAAAMERIDGLESQLSAILAAVTTPTESKPTPRERAQANRSRSKSRGTAATAERTYAPPRNPDNQASRRAKSAMAQRFDLNHVFGQWTAGEVHEVLNGDADADTVLAQIAERHQAFVDWLGSDEAEAYYAERDREVPTVKSTKSKGTTIDFGTGKPAPIYLG